MSFASLKQALLVIILPSHLDVVVLISNVLLLYCSKSLPNAKRGDRSLNTSNLLLVRTARMSSNQIAESLSCNTAELYG